MGVKVGSLYDILSAICIDITLVLMLTCTSKPVEGMRSYEYHGLREMN